MHVLSGKKISGAGQKGYKIGRGKYLLWGNVEGNGPQVNALVRIDARDDKEDSGTLLIKAGHTYIYH